MSVQRKLDYETNVYKQNQGAISVYSRSFWPVTEPSNLSQQTKTLGKRSPTAHRPGTFAAPGTGACASRRGGPFPIVVMIHGGGDSTRHVCAWMKAAPTANFIAELMIYSIDFRPKSPFQAIEWDDACRAVGCARCPSLPASALP